MFVPVCVCLLRRGAAGCARRILRQARRAQAAIDNPDCDKSNNRNLQIVRRVMHLSRTPGRKVCGFQAAIDKPHADKRDKPDCQHVRDIDSNIAHDSPMVCVCVIALSARDRIALVHLPLQNTITIDERERGQDNDPVRSLRAFASYRPQVPNPSRKSRRLPTLQSG